MRGSSGRVARRWRLHSFLNCPRASPEVATGRPPRTEISESSRRRPSLTCHRLAGRRRLRKRTARPGGQSRSSWRKSPKCGALGPLRTSTPKPLLPRKPNLLRTRPTPPRPPPRPPRAIAPSGRERASGRAARPEEPRRGGGGPACGDLRGCRGGGSGRWGRGRARPRTAESARKQPSESEAAGQARARVREPTRAARWARSGTAGRADGCSSGGGRGCGSESQRWCGRQRGTG